MVNKFEKIIGLSLIRLSKLHPRWSTYSSYFFYKKWGLSFIGKPNYISSSVWFDGADYSLIELHEGVTISSNVSFLTHDWSLHMIGKSLGENKINRSRNQKIKVGPHSFIGRGCIIMPGVTIGRGCVIGAGSVVRGEIPDYSIVIGNPAKIVADSREYYKKKKHILLGKE